MAENMRGALSSLHWAVTGCMGSYDPNVQELVKAAQEVLRWHEKKPLELNATEVLQQIRRDGGTTLDVIEKSVALPSKVDRAREFVKSVQQLDQYLTRGGNLPRNWADAKAPK